MTGPTVDDVARMAEAIRCAPPTRATTAQIVLPRWFMDYADRAEFDVNAEATTIARRMGFADANVLVAE